MSKPALLQRLLHLIIQASARAATGIAVSGVCVLQAVSPESAIAATATDAPMKLYWTDIEDDAIYRANLDGSEIEVLFVGDPATNADLYDLDHDPLGTLYWAGHNDGLPAARDAIRRANLDGTDAGVIPIGDPGQSLLPRDVEFDSASGALYVASEGGGIARVNADGSGLEDIYTSRGSSGLALDVPGGKVYWTEWDLDRIMRSNLDGTDVEVLYDYPAFSNNNPQDIEIDQTNGWLFWTNPIGQEIVRSDLDGGNLIVVKTFDNGLPQYLEIDHDNHFIYVTNNVEGTIERIDIDGGNHTVVIAGLNNPIGVMLGPSIAIPEPSSWALLGVVGLLGFAFAYRHRI